jgi:hypothetical protein
MHPILTVLHGSDACVWLRECPAVALLPAEARQAVVIAIASQVYISI